MKVWAVVEHGAPLQCVELPDPQPAGTEVVVDVSHCGVCHSDVHLWHGSYDLGSLTGSIPELREVLALARSGKLEATPVREVPKDQADDIIHRLDRGQIIGRVVLTEPAAGAARPAM